MTPENFVFWLNGYLHDKDTLNMQRYDLIVTLEVIKQILLDEVKGK